VEGTEREHYGKRKAQFCDARDGKKYVYVSIGEQVWMAENLNYNASGSKCYNNSETNCTTYGRLYDWATAMALDVSCNTTTCPVSENYKGICPDGWHLPSNAEWGALMQFVNPSCSLTGDENCANAGTKLKAASIWSSVSKGTDAYYFAALPGGELAYGGVYSGRFTGIERYGYWWSSSESEYGPEHVATLRMGGEDDYVMRANSYKSGVYSVRCLQN